LAAGEQVTTNVNQFTVKVHHQFQFKDLQITSQEVGRAMNLSRKEIDGFKPMIEAILSDLKSADGLECGMIIFPVDDLGTNDWITVDSVSLAVGKTIKQKLSGAQVIAIFICTAGSELSSLPEQLMKTENYIESHIAETIGTLAVEKLANKLHHQILPNSGLNFTNRYSPGHCEWPLDDQQKLFSLLPDNFCDIHLTESLMMQPTKSLSAIIGLGATVKYEKDDCKYCDYQPTCNYKFFRKTQIADYQNLATSNP